MSTDGTGSTSSQSNAPSPVPFEVSGLNNPDGVPSPALDSFPTFSVEDYEPEDPFQSSSKRYEGVARDDTEDFEDWSQELPDELADDAEERLFTEDKEVMEWLENKLAQELHEEGKNEMSRLRSLTDQYSIKHVDT